MIAFDLIKGFISQYTRSSLVYIILETLNSVQRNNYKAYPFWQLLVLLKWTYSYSIDIYFRKIATEKDLNYLLLLTGKFESDYEGVNFTTREGALRSLKIMSYQQFSLQDEYHNIILARQVLLYTNKSSGFDIEVAFKRNTGIQLLEFFKYCFFTYIYISAHIFKPEFKYTGTLHPDYFKLFLNFFPENKLEKFLTLLTIKDETDIRGLQKLDNEIYQLYETNFFTTKPFIYLLGHFRLPHLCLFVQTISHFVYTYLKNKEPLFPSEFGERLERYCELGLKEIGKSCQTGKELKRKYNLTKVTDFLIENNILIEVKAIELHPRSGVTREPEVMARDLQDSIVKAYIQLLLSAHSIKTETEWYGIVITYKEMYLGFGPDAWKEFLQKPVEVAISKAGINLNIDLLPPANLFFISISDWDNMIQVIKDGKAKSVKEILLKAQERNINENTRESITLFEQVFKTDYPLDKSTLSYLKKAQKAFNFEESDKKEN